MLSLLACSKLEAIPNGKLVSHSQKRKGFYLDGDVFNYACNDGYIFHFGASDDYIYKCLDDGNYDNIITPLCITSEHILYEYKLCNT